MTFSGMYFKTLRKRTGLSQAEFGKKIGVSGGQVSLYENGATPPAERLPTIARELGVTVDDLLSGGQPLEESGRFMTGNIVSVRPNISEYYTQVPFLSVKAQAGIPTMRFTENCLAWIEETFPVFLPMVAITEKHLVIEIQGDSMEPEIKSGAIVLGELVSHDDIKYESGGVYAIIYGNNRFVVKRIKTNEINTVGSLTLWSDNDRYGQIVVPGNDIHCMWKVTEKVRESVR